MRLLVCFFFICFYSFSAAQCAMCRAVAESSKDGGSSIADGLNSGILYLMSIPYILLFLAFIFYFKRHKLL